MLIDVDLNGNGSWDHACTLGLVADRDGQRGLITNSHCTSQMFNPDADRFYQLFPRLVATASVDPNAYTCGVQRCRGADAMFASAAAGASMAVGKVLKPQASNGGGYGGGWGTLYVDQTKPYFTVVATGDALVGTRINKVGSTTGWTWGNVAGTCVDGYIGEWPATVNVIRCEDEADYVAYLGDSGAPVFFLSAAGDGTEITFLGLHSNREAVGSRARYSRQSRIQSDLGGSWSMIGGQATLQVSLGGPSVVSNSPSCNLVYTAYASGGSGSYTYSWSTTGTITQNFGSSIMAVFPAEGTHTVSVTVTDTQNHTAGQQMVVTSGAQYTCE